MTNWVSSTALFIGGCVASTVVEKIVDMGLSFLHKRKLSESDAAVKRVETALPQIRAIMGVAEELKTKDSSCSEWIHQFREAVDAAEDVLDELEFTKLEDMVKTQNEVGGSASSSKKRKKDAIGGDILERLKEAVTLLDKATAGVEHILQLANLSGIRSFPESQHEVSKDLRRKTTSFLAEREVFGRNVEKAKIIGWLTRETNAPLSSFGIVGMGGQGKTTLAQFVYQEMCRLGCFEKIIWVCVSPEFSVDGITAKILAELGEVFQGDTPFNLLQLSLKIKIHSKKILLILDDVWEDYKRSDWEQLIAPLRFAQRGSTILFTTRNKLVADLLASVINTEHESLTLRDLEEQELGLLFNSYAFYGFNPNNYEDFRAIGDQIVKKVRGSPLAAKVLGSLLNSHMDQDYWRRILKQDSVINLEEVEGVIEVLKLSYYNLPADIQVCFRFCSIFPEGHTFDKEELIKMWMASGFIRQKSFQEERPEDIGEFYFNHLLKKSFLEYSWDGDGERYVMHDLVYELAQNVSNGEYWRVSQNDKSKSIIIPSTVRHVSIPDSAIERLSHLGNIRSLVVTTCTERIETNPNLCVLPNSLIKKSLRVLKIHVNRSFKLPDEIGFLVHLRYLSIELKDIVSPSFEYFFPASIYKLYHLQVLELVGDYPISPFFEIENTEMANLVSLRYMRLPDQIMRTIYGVHRLESLQELTFFVGQGNGYRIDELRTLNNLRHLTIYNIENIGSSLEARDANLLRKESLKSLSLTWTSGSNSDNPEQIIASLQPHPNLVKLKIENYEGHRYPIWMREMPCLKFLDIYGFPNLDNLPDLPLSLIEIRLRDVGLNILPKLYQSYNTNTPRLKSSLRLLEITKCPNLGSLNGFLQQEMVTLDCFEELIIKNCENLTQLPEEFSTFLSIKHLHIGDCPNLTRLPYCLPLSLITFDINGMAVSELPLQFQTPYRSGSQSTSSFKSSLRLVYIRNCPNLIALNGFFQQDDIDFQAINIICIEECGNLVQIPRGVFLKFVSLTNLTIVNCPTLEAVDNQNNLLPSNLKMLHMKNCGDLEVPLLESSAGHITLTDLKIVNCANITRIPSSQNVFEYLSKLSISGCSRLIELSLMQQAHNVDQGNNLAHLNINDLSIDQLSLLLIEPLRNLRSVSVLLVSFCSGMEALPEQWLLQNSDTLRRLTILNARTLQSLPDTMVRLTALEELLISHADLLIELPELPASLKFKHIYGLGNRLL